MPKDKDQPIFLKEYFEAQCLFHEGKLTESLKLLQHSLNELRVIIQISKSIWERTYVSCALLYAQNLDYLNKFDDEYAIFQELLEFSPDDFYLGEYAVFLHKRKKDYNNAEKYYIKSLELFPYQASIHLKYAGFLRYIRNDLVNAEKHYEAAVDANPESSETVGNYSSFLHSIHNIEKAEIMYQRAVDIDQNNINNLCNYGLLLSEERHRYHLAEDYYKLALKVSENQHSNTFYNYAVMLDTHCNRKPEAESLYRQAIQIESRHSYALYNLAVLLEDKEKYRNTHLNDNVTDNNSNNNSIAESKNGKDSSPHQHTKNTTNDVENKNSSSSFQYSFSSLSSSSPLELTQEILFLYQRAHLSDPQDATIAADYGRYQLMQYNTNTAASVVSFSMTGPDADDNNSNKTNKNSDNKTNNNKTNNNNSNIICNSYNSSDLFDDAEVALATALKIDPKSEVALFNMGVLLQRYVVLISTAVCV